MVAVATLARYEKSVPFSLIYLVDDAGTTARLVACSGVDPSDAQTCPPAIDLTGPDTSTWPLGEAMRRDGIVEIERLDRHLWRVPP